MWVLSATRSTTRGESRCDDEEILFLCNSLVLAFILAEFVAAGVLVVLVILLVFVLIRVAGVDEELAAADEFDADVDSHEDSVVDEDDDETDEDLDLECRLDGNERSVLSATIESVLNRS